MDADRKAELVSQVASRIFVRMTAHYGSSELNQAATRSVDLAFQVVNDAVNRCNDSRN